MLLSKGLVTSSAWGNIDVVCTAVLCAPFVKAVRLGQMIVADHFWVRAMCPEVSFSLQTFYIHSGKAPSLTVCSSSAIVDLFSKLAISDHI